MFTLMSTVVSVLFACAWMIWKTYDTKQIRRMIEEERARYIGNLVKLQEHITAIEQRLTASEERIAINEQRIDGSPFIPPKPKDNE